MNRPPLPHLYHGFKLLYRFYTTEMGRAVFSSVLLVGCFSILQPTYHVLAVLTCLLAGGFVLGFIFRPCLRVKGKIPHKMIVGKIVTIRYEITNLSHRPAYDLALEMFGGLPFWVQRQRGRMIPRLGPRETTGFEISLEPTRRGIYELEEPRWFSTFPFNLFRHGPWRRPKNTVVVWPSFRPLGRIDIAPDLRYQPGGIVMASHVGESPEYLGNRPFRPGDSPRKIDTRAWARLAQPVVKEFQEEYYCHLAVILDTYMPSRSPKMSAPFEAAVSLAAGAVDCLSREDRIIDFFAAGPQLFVFRSGRNIAQFENLLDVLAGVEASRTDPFITLAPTLDQELRQTSSVVFILLDWDAHREKLVRFAAELGCDCRVLIVRDRAPSQPYAVAEAWAGPITVLSPETIQNEGVTAL